MATSQTSRTELIVDLDHSGSTGQEGGVVFTRDSTTNDVEGSLRYRSPIGINSDSNISSLESPDPDPEGFVDVSTQDPIATALEQCEKWVLRPYRFVLKMLGWTPFTKDGDSMLQKFLRVCLVLFWLIVIILAFIVQILSCFRRDSVTPTPLNATTKIRTITCQEHVISSFILPDLLLLASYCFGLYLFSKDETEYLSNLAEKAFVKGVQAKLGINKKLISTIFGFGIVGILWIVFSFAVRILSSFALDFWSSKTTIMWGPGTTFSDGGKYTLVILSLIGFIFFDMVYLAAVMNYATQSEMNIYLFKAIRRMVIQKYHPDIDAAIKDILECRQYLRVLNGKTATATALIMFNLGSAGVIAMVALHKLSEDEVLPALRDKATVAVAINVLLWISLVTFPFIQAARVSNAAEELKASGPEVRARTLQYSKTPQIELDSFVSLTRAVKLRATIFGIPVYPWLMWIFVTAFFFVALILFQTGTYNFTPYL